MAILALRRRDFRATPRAGGFTLIEMIAVIVLLGLVMTIVGGQIMNRFNSAKYNTGKVAVRSLAGKIENYIIDNGSPPAQLEDLVTRPGNAPNWNGPYAKESDLKDPWGHAYSYKVPGEHGDFDLIFLGKDGQPGGTGLDADYGNWQ